MARQIYPSNLATGADWWRILFLPHDLSNRAAENVTLLTPPGPPRPRPPPNGPSAQVKAPEGDFLRRVGGCSRPWLSVKHPDDSPAPSLSRD